MTKRERVVAALRGAPVDRVPVSLWLHNFATENSADTLAAETLRLAHRFDWDFLKPQSRAQCFAEMWGLRYAPSRERETPYTVTRAPLATAEDLRRLEPADARTGSLGEQLQALQAIRKAVGAGGGGPCTGRDGGDARGLCARHGGGGRRRPVLRHQHGDAGAFDRGRVSPLPAAARSAHPRARRERALQRAPRLRSGHSLRRVCRLSSDGFELGNGTR